MQKKQKISAIPTQQVQTVNAATENKSQTTAAQNAITTNTTATTSAESTPENSNTKTVIPISNAPPPGFEHLEEKQETIVDVYFGHLFVGTYAATFSPNMVQFKDPVTLVKALKNITDIKKVTSALSGELKTNSDKLCSSQYRNNCGVLTPKIAGVIFDPSTYRVDVFVNPDYIQGATLASSLLPPSDAGFSYVNDLRGVVTGSDNNQAYNVNSRNVFAYQNARLNGNVSYAKSNSADIDQWQVNNLNAGVNYGRYEVQAGAITSKGSILIPSQFLLGASWGTAAETIVDGGNTYGTPLEVFLTSPSKVSIFRDGRLLSSGFYQPGKQLLNTAGLPDGAYEVTIEIEGENGNKRTETQFFAKTAQIPPMQYPTYYVDAGYLQKTGVFNTVLPEYSSTLLFEAGMAKRILNWWGVNSSVIGEGEHNYISGGIFVLGNGWQVSPDVLYGSKGEYGAAMNALLNVHDWYSSLYARQLWAHYQQRSNSGSSNDPFVPADVDFAPIVGDSTLLSATISHTFNTVTVSLNGSLNKRKGQDDIYSYGPTVRAPLWHNQSVNLNLDMSVARTQADTEYLATLRIDYRPYESNWTHSASLGYQDFSDVKPGSTQINRTGFDGSLASTWNNFDAAQNGWQAGINASADPNRSTTGAQATYNSFYGSANAQVQRNYGGKTIDNTQYNASFDTHIAYASKTAAIGGVRSGNAGMIIDIRDPKNSTAKFNVFIDNQLMKTVEVNTPTLVILQPYKTYKVYIQAIGQHFFEYTQTPKSVTLYRGNYMTLNWDVTQKVILFTKVMQKNGKPLSNKLINGGIGVNVTDADGSLQLEASSNVKVLQSTLQNGKACSIHLPKYKVEDGIALLDNVVCQ